MTNTNYRFKYDWAALGILIVFILLKLPLLGLPFYWDEAWVYAPAVKIMAENGPSLLPDALPVFFSRGHPLLFHFLGGTWVSVFGESNVSLHSFGLAVSLGLLVAVYIIGKRLFHPVAGIASMVVLSVQTSFFVQSTFVLPEIMVALWTLLFLFAYIEQKKLLYFLSGGALLLTKESGVVAMATIGLFYLFKAIGQSKFSLKSFFNPKQLLWMASPVLPLLLFLLIQRLQMGWFLYPEHTGMISLDWSAVSGKLKAVATYVFIRNGRLILWLMALVGIFWGYKKANSFGEIVKIKQFTLLGLLFVCLYALFSSINFFTIRYLLSVLPIIVLLTVGLSWYYYPKKPALWLVFVAINISTAIPFLLDKSGRGDTDPGFSEAVKAFESVIHYCESQKWQQQGIATDFLMKTGLTEPRSGYLRDKVPFSKVGWGIEDDTTILILGNMENGQKRLEDYKNIHSLSLIKRFETANTWFEIYKITR